MSQTVTIKKRKDGNAKGVKVQKPKKYRRKKK